MSLLRLHRWMSLACLAFWAVQALTGVLIVFHWEIDDAFVPGSRAAFDAAAIERRIEAIAPQGSPNSVGSLWESGGEPGRYDLYVDGPNGSSVLRIDGAGRILRERVDGERFANGGWMDTLVTIHHNLLGGDFGSWIVGLSGLLLLSNLLLGLAASWPRRGRWRSALLPASTQPGGAPHAYAWHRAIGLWGAVPALAMVSAGTMLVFSDPVAELVGGQAMEPLARATAAGRGDVGFAEAVAAATGTFPKSRVSGVTMPSEDFAFYKVRLLQPGEWRRIYGTTTVFVNASDGSVALASDALDDGASRSFVDGLFPFHTGEMGGPLGRFMVLAIGCWLLTMIVLGLMLWRKRARR